MRQLKGNAKHELHKIWEEAQERKQVIVSSVSDFCLYADLCFYWPDTCSQTVRLQPDSTGNCREHFILCLIFVCVCVFFFIIIITFQQKNASMFPEMWSVLVGGRSVKFHSQVAYFCVCISLSAFGVGHGLSVQPWSPDGNYLGFFFLFSRFSYSFLRGAITEASTSNFTWIKMSL